MTESLEELLSSQQVLLSSISHELRTPLTRLQLALALLRRRFGEDNTEIHRIEIEARRLDKMINYFYCYQDSSCIVMFHVRFFRLMNYGKRCLMMQYLRQNTVN